MKNYLVFSDILLFSLFSVGLSLLEINTRFDELTNEYVAEEGDSISLMCTPSHNGAYGVSIYRCRESYNGWCHRLQFYELKEANGIFTANIESLSHDDSTVYICDYFYRRACRRWWCEVWAHGRVNLYVISSTPEKKSCSLVTDTNGIFFINGSLTLRCYGDIGDDLDISFLDGNITVEYDGLVSNDDSETDATLWTIPRLSDVFNNAIVVCGDDGDTDGNEDLCSNVGLISVLAGFEVTVSHEGIRVPNRGNATLTCYSELLYLASSSEWNYLGGDVTFGNILMSVDPEGIYLTLTDIDFTNSTSGGFTVSCKVTVGSRNASGTATIYQERTDTTTATSTTGGDGLNEGSLASNMTSVVAISVMIGLLVICAAVVSAIIWYRRSSSRIPDATSKVGGTDGRMEKRDEADVRSDPRTPDDHHYEQTNARLGYSSPDAVVVDNVAYVSYDSGST